MYWKTDKELIAIYRGIKEFMTFKDMLTNDYIVYLEDEKIHIKYNVKSINKNTDGEIMCWNVRTLTYQELISNIWQSWFISYNPSKNFRRKINWLWYDNIEDLEYDVRMKVLKEGVSFDWKENKSLPPELNN